MSQPLFILLLCSFVPYIQSICGPGLNDQCGPDSECCIDCSEFDSCEPLEPICRWVSDGFCIFESFPSPTEFPTHPPTIPDSVCQYSELVDVIFLIDQTCGLTSQECAIQQQGISNLVMSLKQYSSPRIGYIEFHTNAQRLVIALNSTIINNLNDPELLGQEWREDISLLISNLECNENNMDTGLYPAIDFAVQHFEKHYVDGRDMRLVIVSNCEADGVDGRDVCNAILPSVGSLIVNGEDVEVIVVNIADTQNSDIADPSRYLECLISEAVFPPQQRIFAITQLQSESFLDILDDFAFEICDRRPTKSPTDSPTKKPTPHPSREPTLNPSENPTEIPTPSPTEVPTDDPTQNPTNRPTDRPTPLPTNRPTDRPTTDDPTPAPTDKPTDRPTTHDPTPLPTPNPTARPTGNPTYSPTSYCDDCEVYRTELIDCEIFEQHAHTYETITEDRHKVCLTYEIQMISNEHCGDLRSIYLPLCVDTDINAWNLNNVIISAASGDMDLSAQAVYEDNSERLGILIWDVSGIEQFVLCLKDVTGIADHGEIADWVQFDIDDQISKCFNSDGLPCLNFVPTEPCYFDCVCNVGLSSLNIRYLHEAKADYIAFQDQYGDILCEFTDVYYSQDMSCVVSGEYNDGTFEEITYFVIHSGGDVCQGSLDTSCQSQPLQYDDSCDGIQVTAWFDKDGNVCDETKK